MKFLYDKNAGNERIKIVNEAFLHLKADPFDFEAISRNMYLHPLSSAD